MTIPVIGNQNQNKFTGTGDLLSAMLLANVDRYPQDFGKAVEVAVNIVRGVLKKTLEEPIMGTNEIQLIKSKDVIEDPEI